MADGGDLLVANGPLEEADSPGDSLCSLVSASAPPVAPGSPCCGAAEPGGTPRVKSDGSADSLCSLVSPSEDEGVSVGMGVSTPAAT